jgi:MFS family permease
MATTALILHVQRATGSATAVGLLLFAQAVPPLLAPFAGVIADRFQPRHLLVAGWLVQAVIAALLALQLSPPRALLVVVCATCRRCVRGAVSGVVTLADAEGAIWVAGRIPAGNVMDDLGTVAVSQVASRGWLQSSRPRSRGWPDAGRRSSWR